METSTSNRFWQRAFQDTCYFLHDVCRLKFDTLALNASRELQYLPYHFACALCVDLENGEHVLALLVGEFALKQLNR